MMRKEQLWGFLLAILVVAGIAGGTVLLRQSKTFSFSDENAGVSFQIRSSYQQVLREDKEEKRFSKENKLVAHFVREDPPVLITVRYDTGLRKATALLRRNLIEHFTYEIRQFFPIRYPGYEAGLLEPRRIAGREALEHIFSYQDADGTRMKMRLFLVPWDEGTAYYLILQAKEQEFRKVASDLDVLRKTLVLSGPKSQNPNENTKP